MPAMQVFEGNLGEGRILEALQAIVQERRTGILTVQGEEDILAVSFAEGQIVAADALNLRLDEALGRKLIDRELLTEERFNTIQTKTRETGVRLIDALVEKESLDRGEILVALRDLTLDLLYTLLEWLEGDFKFYNTDEVSYEEGFRPISLKEWLALRAATAEAVGESESAATLDEASHLERDRLSLAEMLRAVAGERRTGTVTVQGARDFVAISCAEGEVLGAETLQSTLEDLLSEKLLSNELLTTDAYGRIQAERDRTHGRLLDTLLETPGLERSAVLHTLRLAVVDLIAPLLDQGNWEVTEVRFYPSDQVPYEEGFFPIPVAELLSLRDSDEPVPSEQLARRVRALERDLQELRRKWTVERKWPSRFLELQQRTQAVLRSPSQGKAAWLQLSSKALAARLRSHGFFLAAETCRALRTALLRKQIIVLEGVPGSGKSLLAQLLPRLLLESHPKSGTTHLAVNGHPSLAVEDFIGDRAIVDGQVGPAAGPLLEALLRCHESTSGHWLIVDEFNRARADALFAPLLDALSHADGRLRHPHMFPDREVEEAEIPIPSTFRILGTMNHLDKGLFEISQALRQRIQIVPIPTLRGEIEMDLVRRKVLDPWWKDSLTGISGKPPLKGLQELARSTTRRLHEVAEQIRDLSARQPASQYAPCELGSRLILESVQAILLRLGEDHGEDHDPGTDELSEMLDSTIQEIFLSQLSACGTDAIRSLLTEVFEPSFPRASQALRQVLDTRRVF